MDLTTARLAVGGSCHWCTEAMFRSLRGVASVEQGWVASDGADAGLSEGVIITYDPRVITQHDLIAVHLHTHACTSNHSMRHTYRSAVYVFDACQHKRATASLQRLQADFDAPLITRVLPFVDFEPSRDKIRDYYFRNPRKPFCRTVIHPKLMALLERYAHLVDDDQRAIIEGAAQPSDVGAS